MTSPSSTDTAKRVADIRARVERATEGPWKYCGCGKCGLVWCIPADVVVAGIEASDEGYTGGEGVSNEARGRNAEFIANAREDVPWLLDQLSLQERRIQELESALREIAEGEGPFSMDPLTFAENTIEAMKRLAREAVTPI